MEENIVHTKGTPEFRDHLDKRRLAPGAPRKSFEATQMWDNYQEVIRRVVLGQKNVDIARDLNLAPETVSYIKNSPLVQERIQTLQAQADADTVTMATRIKELAPIALGLIESSIKSGQVGTEKIPALKRIEHANGILDRAGFSPPKEIRSHILHGHYTAEDLQRIKERAKLSAGTLIVEDTEYEEVQQLPIAENE